MRPETSSEVERLKYTVIWSWEGWLAAWRSEASVRHWTRVNLLSAALAFWLDLAAGERALILVLGILILAAELANTAIEEVVNMVSPSPHPMAKKAKDCGSALVALTALAGGVAWLVVLVG